jgi:hypothetical protein
VPQHAQFVWQVDFQAQDNPNVLSVLLGNLLLPLVPFPNKHVLPVVLAGSVRLVQLRAQTAGLDTIQMVMWLALLARQEPSQQALAAKASLIAQNVWLGSSLPPDLLAVLRVLLDGILNYLGRVSVLPAQQGFFQMLSAQRPISVKYASNPPLPRREQAHALTVLQDVTSRRTALALALIAGHALQASTCQSVVCSV